MGNTIGKPPPRYETHLKNYQLYHMLLTANQNVAHAQQAKQQIQDNSVGGGAGLYPESTPGEFNQKDYDRWLTNFGGPNSI